MAVSIHPVTWLHADIHAGAGADAARAAAERLLSALLARHASELRAASESVLEAEFVGPIAAVECARRMQTVVARLNEARGTVAAVGLAVGVDVGAAEAGQARARRIAASARDGEILVSAAARASSIPTLGLCTRPRARTTGPENRPAPRLRANRVEWNPPRRPAGRSKNRKPPSTF
ncbi:hypothetical protein HS125_08715 [bacterium]|nr:hypothetical protein [bacterium]